VENKQPQTAPADVRENIMGTMDINPLLIKLSVPMMISMLVQALYNVVDSIFVSHVSENALTAVSLAFSLQNVMIAVGVGTGVGVNALLSKSLGEKDQARANQTAENGIFLSLCSYAVFLLIGLTCMKPYFYAQTSDMDIARQGILYLSICCVLSLGLFTQTMGEKLLAATGRTHLSMISQLVGAVVNIVLDPIFIFGYCGEALSGTTGAGIEVDGYEMVDADLFGLMAKPAMHAKTYGNLLEFATNVYGAWVNDVRTKAYPTEQNGWHMDPAEYEKFLDAVEKL